MSGAWNAGVGGDRGWVTEDEREGSGVMGKRGWVHSLWGWGSNTEMKKMTFGDAIKSSFILNINYRHSFKKIIFCFISRLGREEGPKQGRKEGKVWGG